MMESGAGRKFEIPFLLSADAAQQKLVEQYRWVLISGALKSRKLFAIQEVMPPKRLYYPFLTGYYRLRNRWRFEVCDAVSGMRQGGKVREALLKGWTRGKGL